MLHHEEHKDNQQSQLHRVGPTEIFISLLQIHHNVKVTE